MHYTQEYYDYGIEAINIIMQEKSKKDEEKMLIDLYNATNNIYAEKYFKNVSDSLLKIFKENKIIDRKKTYYLGMNEFLNAVYKDKKNVNDFFIYHKIKKILIYGRNDISEFILKNKTSDIDIMDIMDKNIKTIKNEFEINIDKYRLYDAIIISDITDSDIIYNFFAKIKLNSYKIKDILNWLYAR